MCSKVDPLKPDSATQICKSDSELEPDLRRNGDKSVKDHSVWVLYEAPSIPQASDNIMF